MEKEIHQILINQQTIMAFLKNMPLKNSGLFIPNRMRETWELLNPKVTKIEDKTKDAFQKLNEGEESQ